MFILLKEWNRMENGTDQKINSIFTLEKNGTTWKITYINSLENLEPIGKWNKAESKK